MMMIDECVVTSEFMTSAGCFIDLTSRNDREETSRVRVDAKWQRNYKKK